MDEILSFAQGHPVVVVALALGLLYFMYRAPKVFFGIFALGLLLAGLFYLIMSISGQGSERKKKLIHGEENQVDRNR